MGYGAFVMAGGCYGYCMARSKASLIASTACMLILWLLTFCAIQTNVHTHKKLKMALWILDGLFGLALAFVFFKKFKKITEHQQELHGHHRSQQEHQQRLLSNRES